jgi:DNA-binding phage protein
MVRRMPRPLLPRRLDALAQLTWHFFADPCPVAGGGRGALGLGAPELSLVTWAVLLSEADGRPMVPSKLADFAGLPRATLYRKLEMLRRRGVLVLRDGAVRADAGFLDDAGLAAATELSVVATRACADLLRDEPAARRDALRDVPLPPIPLPIRLDVLGRLALELARLAHGSGGPWFAAETREWMTRWAIVQAQMAESRRDPATLASRTGLSRAAIYRQLAEFERKGAILRPVGQELEFDLTGAFAIDLERAVTALDKAVLKAVHRLSDLDGEELAQ